MKSHPRPKSQSHCLYTALALLLLFILAQPLPAQTFERTYGQTGVREGGQCIAALDDGNMVLGGYRGDRALLIFVNADGDRLFERTFKATTPNRSDIISDIKVDSDGILYGTGTGRGLFPMQGFAFRYDYQNDNLIWVRQFVDPSPGTTHTIGLNIQEQNPGGNYTVFGQISSSPDNGYMASLNRNTGTLTGSVNSEYQLVSSVTFSSSTIVPTAFGIPRFFVTGRYAFAGSANSMRASITELRPDGNIVRSRSYYVPTNQNARHYSNSIKYDGKDLVIAGSGDRNGSSTTNTTCNLSLHNIDDLTMTWGNEYLFPSYSNEIFHQVMPHQNGYLALGRDLNSRTLFLMKTDNLGNVDWAYEYGNLNEYTFPYLGEDELIFHNGSLYLLAQIPEAADPDLSDIVLFRINADGTMSDDCRFEPINPSVEPYQVDYDNNLTPQPTTNQMVAVAPQLQVPFMEDQFICSEPCFALTDSNYVNITAPITITSDEAWTGKFYVADGVIITVDDATLDLTQVDLVFGKCAGIDFINDAHLRANNTVFRTCDEGFSWRGLQFMEQSDGVIHECTFKNAQRAIGVVNSIPNNTALLRISGNHFVNNQWAIDIERTQLSDAITGNQFLITNAEINYQPNNCQNTVPSSEFIGIRASRSQFEGSIAQNSFINTSPSPGNKVLRGMFMIQSSGTASSNTFTDNYTAVELSNSSSFSLENNQLELTNGYLGNQSQIRVSGLSSSISITGNHVINSNEEPLFSATNTGIYVEDGALINIKENQVEGFSNGIHAINLRSSNIGENLVSNFNRFGIQILNGLQLDITCNEVNARFPTSASAIGIYYFKNNSIPQQIRIRNNCVFNCAGAVYLYSTTSVPLPAITNNYLYNYRRTGIRNINFTGGIGTSIGSFATSGRNTFTCNNIPNGALDINSNVNILAAGNSGISSVSGTVTVLGNGLYHATTACGHQIGNVNQQITPDEACDRFSSAVNQKLSQLGQSPSHILDMLDEEQTIFSNYRITQAWMAKMDHEELSNQEVEVLAHLLTSSLLDPDAKSLLQYEFHARRGELSEARAALASVSNLSPEFRALRTVYELDEMLSESNRNLTELTEGEINLLRSVSDKAYAAGDNAWDYLHLAIGGHPFRYPTVEVPDQEVKTDRILLEDGNFTIFPNPSKGQITLEYYLEQVEGAHLQIFDLQGRMLMDRPLNANAQRMELDLSHLKAGVYFVSLLDQSGRLSRKKLVKI